MFDSSVTRGEPASFPLNGVIAGWTEGVQLMVEGERRRFGSPKPRIPRPPRRAGRHARLRRAVLRIIH